MIELNKGVSVAADSVIGLHLLDTAKFKSPLKEYDKAETFVTFRDKDGFERMVRITRDKAKELLGMGFTIRLPDGTVMKKGGK